MEPLSCTSTSSGAGSDRTVVQMAGLPRCGPLRVEATKGALLSPEPRAVLVLPDAAAVAELRQLEPAVGAGTWLRVRRCKGVIGFNVTPARQDRSQRDRQP